MDLTARFTAEELQATGLLETEDALTDGPHVLTVHVFDQAGNALVIEDHPFAVDTAPPIATVTEPSAAYLSSSPTTVRAVYSDVGSGIDPLSVRVLVDGEDRTESFVVSSTEAVGTLEPSLGDGLHTILFEIEDGAGHPPESPASVTFTVDTLPPVVTVSAPTDDVYLQQSPVTVTGTVTDADPQVTLTCQADGATVDAVVDAGTFTCALPLAEGTNTLEVVASDRFRAGDPVTRTVHLDTTPPQVIILDPPADPFFTSLDTLTVSGTVQDASPVESVVVNGIDATVDGMSFSATGVPVTGGPIQAVATDAAGHTGVGTVNVVLDGTPPVVGITSPDEGAWVSGPSVEVTGNVEDDLSPTMVEVNGQPELDSSQELSRTFRVTVSASDGPLTLQARALDSAGNSGQGPARSVNVDSTPPLVVIDDPTEDPLVTKETSIRVAGLVQDASPVTLVVHGQTTVPVGGRFERDIPLADEGKLVIVATATDQVGFTGGDETTVWVDRTPPTLSVLSPEVDDLVFSNTVVVQGLVSDEPAGVPENALVVTVDGQAATITDGAWSIELSGLPDGPHTFEVVATDKAGNTRTVFHDVVMDLLPPTVAITSPLSPTLTRLATIAVDGTAIGRGTVTVEVRSGPSTVSVPASGGVWSVPVFPLVEGDNTLSAVARSQSGRQSIPDYTLVTLDSIPPALEILVPETVAPGSPEGGLITAVDNRPGAVTVEVQIDGVTVAAGPAPLAFEILAPPGTPAGSTLVVDATATDVAGNLATGSEGVKVAGEGVVVGHVLADETSLPIQGATVALEGPSGAQAATTDERGRFRFLTGDPDVRVRSSHAERTAVEREVAVTPEVGTVTIDARLTPLGEPVTLGVAGGGCPRSPCRPRASSASWCRSTRTLSPRTPPSASPRSPPRAYRSCCRSGGRLSPPSTSASAARPCPCPCPRGHSRPPSPASASPRSTSSASTSPPGPGPCRPPTSSRPTTRSLSPSPEEAPTPWRSPTPTRPRRFHSKAP